jgi:hypothetical protein
MSIPTHAFLSEIYPATNKNCLSINNIHQLEHQERSGRFALQDNVLKVLSSYSILKVVACSELI